MSEEIEKLKACVEAQLDCTATWVNTMPVAAKASGKLVWDGNVHIFDLVGHPSCPRCYAWWAEDFGPLEQRSVIVQLRENGVTSAAEAVVAAMG
ncbi:MAG: hypothetical protein ACR2PA_05175 [Hyphomicrobiaceae bacterium]